LIAQYNASSSEQAAGTIENQQGSPLCRLVCGLTNA